MPAAKRRIMTVIGFTTEVTLAGENKNSGVLARIDTGAQTSSIDRKLAEELGLGPELPEMKLIRSASGHDMRKLIRAKIIIHGKEINAKFTLANRAHMKYPVLIGRNILKKGFIIDPRQKQ